MLVVGDMVEPRKEGLPLRPEAFAVVLAVAVDNTAPAAELVVAVGSTGRVEAAHSTGLFAAGNLRSSLPEPQTRQGTHIDCRRVALALGSMALCANV